MNYIRNIQDAKQYQKEIKYTIEELIKEVTNNKFLSKKFTNKYLKLFKKISDEKIFIESRKAEQVFTVDYTINKYNLKFDLNYIVELNLQNLHKAKKIILENKNRLEYNHKNVVYTQIPKYEIKEQYKDLNKILIIDVITSFNEYIVIDGNHRINYLLNKKTEKIFAYYIPLMDACLSLRNEFEIYMCLFLYDIQRINIEQQLKMHSWEIYKKSYIKNKAFQVIVKKRKAMLKNNEKYKIKTVINNN